MQVLSLDLVNTKSYEAGRIDFATGVNAIVGHNGAGKSTVLEAIGFVLFDALDYRQEEFVREGADSADIIVTFASSLDNRTYQVTRRCGSHTQYRVFDPELSAKLCEGKADVLRFLRQHMGVDLAMDLPSLFRDAVGVPQGMLTAVFLESASKRKVTFDRLLQVEEYNRAANKLVEPARLLRERRQTVDLQLSGVQARLERLPQLEAEVRLRAEQIRRVERSIGESEQRLALLVAQRSALESWQQQMLSLRTRHGQASQLLLRSETQLRSAEQALRQAEEAQQTVARAQPGYARYQAAQAQQKQLEGLVRERTHLERQRAELDKALTQAQTELAGLLRNLEAVDTARQTVAELSSAVQKQTELEGALALAQQGRARLADAQKLAAQQEQHRQRFAERIAELTAQVAQIAPLEAQQEQLEARSVELRTCIDAERERAALLKSNGDLLNKQKSTLLEITTARCPVCEQPLTEEHRADMLATIAERLQELRADYKRSQDQVKTHEATLQREQTELKQLQEQVRRLPRGDELTRAQQELSSIEMIWQRTQAQVAELAATPQQVTELTAALTALGNPRQRYTVAESLVGRSVELEAQRTQIEARVQAGLTKVAAVGEALTHFATLDRDVETVNADLRRYEADYHAVLTHAQLAESIAARQSDRMQAQNLFALTTSEVAQIEHELAAVTAKFDEASFRQVLDEEQEVRRQLGGLQAEGQFLRQQQAREEQEIAALRIQQAEAEKLSANRKQIEEQETLLEAMRHLLKQAGPQITKALIQQVSSSADQIFCDMMQDYTRRLRWNDDYGITLEAGGHERQFAQLSGGEQMTAALAVRLALLREMSTIDIAFFDEPTTNLDETRRDALVRQVLDVKGFRQLFVISHDDTFEQATQNLIRIERLNGKSVVVQG